MGLALTPLSQHQIQRTLATVAAVRFSDGCDVGCVATCGQPVEDFCPDRPAPVPSVGRIHRARLAGNHQHKSRIHCLGLRQPCIQPPVRLVQCVAMQIECEIRVGSGTRQAALPV